MSNYELKIRLATDALTTLYDELASFRFIGAHSYILRFQKLITDALNCLMERGPVARPTWEEYALNLAYAASLRSEDPYVKVGCVALRSDNSVAGVGYNGTAPGIKVDMSDRDARRPFMIHAEQNCLRYCKPGEVALLATTLNPCSNCLTTIASYGVKKVVYHKEYTRDELAHAVARKFNIELKKI